MGCVTAEECSKQCSKKEVPSNNSLYMARLKRTRN
jgi:hypothetical protein